jgi:DNA replication protein DnaC
MIRRTLGTAPSKIIAGYRPRYRSLRGLDRALFQKLIGGEWINAHDNLALIGPTGVGKSWLASALGNKACHDNRSVLYQRVPRLFEELALARPDPGD